MPTMAHTNKESDARLALAMNSTLNTPVAETRPSKRELAPTPTLWKLLCSRPPYWPMFVSTTANKESRRSKAAWLTAPTSTLQTPTVCAILARPVTLNTSGGSSGNRTEVTVTSREFPRTKKITGFIASGQHKRCCTLNTVPRNLTVASSINSALPRSKESWITPKTFRRVSSRHSKAQTISKTLFLPLYWRQIGRDKWRGLSLFACITTVAQLNCTMDMILVSLSLFHRPSNKRSGHLKKTWLRKRQGGVYSSLTW